MILNIVQWFGVIMIKDFETKAKILEVCREIISNEGLASLNMRKVARLSDLAIGSLYYYFPSKDSLLIASIESVWEDIFSIENVDLDNFDTANFVKFIYDNIKKGMERYPNFLTIHSLSFSKGKDIKAKAIMDNFLRNLENDLIRVFVNDTKIKAGVFTDDFSEKDLARFIISNMHTVWIYQKSPDTLIKVIKKILY